MSDDLVKRICQKWIDVGCADECFWEGWPECPTPEDRLTPRMVLDRIEELKAKRLANRVAIMRLEAKLAIYEDALRHIAQHDTQMRAIKALSDANGDKDG